MSILQPSSQTAAALNKMMAQAAENHVPKTATALNKHQQQFRHAMSNLAAAVNIVTTDGEAGRAGFTASAVCSVTDSPPTLLVCLNRNASVYPVFQTNQVLCVNTLAQQHTQLSNLFGGKTPMPERFAQGLWTSLSTGSPVLTDAVVAFDCKISQVVAMGTHDILLCEVQDLQLNHTGAQGLIYFDRAYHHLTPQQS
ncbi:NADH-dependent FMN reductase RutF [Acinetobacter sp. ANC 4641]|uniref:NADH-dependent FMN reductase RutF n=1 Tax=Acinetobacter sp. ANC 4641 TaxID=2529847 RepID=UPI00103D1B05|nr:pyrimidine utilization flavin reductase protein F [Acinetobacter sp. ANC 4641]